MCESCQIFGDTPRFPSIEQTPIMATWSFDVWGIDLMRKFSKTQSGYKYLVVEVDYFSKWIKAKPLVHPREEKILNFFYDNVLCRYGVPELLSLTMEHNSQQDALHNASI